MTAFDLLSALLNVVLTSALTAALIFLSFRWILNKIFNPMISAGASLLGQKSGSNRATRAVTNEVAEQILSTPKLAGMKMIASNLGFDIDGMIEEHGALETLTGIQQVLSMLGIDVMKVAQEGLGGLTGTLKSGGSQHKNVFALAEG